MPAYAKALQLVCVRCRNKKATVEVFDRWNGSYGPHCSTCGKAKVAELNRVK